MHAPVHDEYVCSGDLAGIRKVHALLNRQSWPDFRVPLLWKTNFGKNWKEANEE